MSLGLSGSLCSRFSRGVGASIFMLLEQSSARSSALYGVRKHVVLASSRTRKCRREVRV